MSMLRPRCAPGLWAGGLAAEPGCGQQGKTALDIAEAQGYSEIVALLRAVRSCLGRASLNRGWAGQGWEGL